MKYLMTVRGITWRTCSTGGGYANHFRFGLSTVLLVIGTFMLTSCRPDPTDDKPAHTNTDARNQQGTLLLEQGMPLLEHPANNQQFPPRTSPTADNDRCFVCHINYADEFLAVRHATANIGCEYCHGPSDAHCSDEYHLTPPGIMYPRQKVNHSCMTCHPRAEIDVQPHQGLFPAGDKNCTDCHGRHRLGYRARKWDKATGDLLEGGHLPIMTNDMPK